MSSGSTAARPSNCSKGCIWEPWEANSWQQLVVSGAPSARQLHSVAFSDFYGFYVFGGISADGVRLNDLFWYKPDTGWQSWTPRGGASSGPQRGLAWSTACRARGSSSLEAPTAAPETFSTKDWPLEVAISMSSGTSAQRRGPLA